VNEEAVVFGEGARLSGVLTSPDGPVEDRPTVVLLNAGRIHRVGPNRLYVKLARRLGALGYPVVRFDLSGIGESGAREDDRPLPESVVADTASVMNHLGANRGSDRFVLMGVCSGAAFSAGIALADSRVVGVVLINARGYEGRTSVKLRAYARKFRRHYWRMVLRRPGSAVHALRGSRAVSPLPLDPSPANGRRHAAGSTLASLTSRGVPTLIVYSDSDIGLDYLRVTQEAQLRESLASSLAELEIIPEADHVFTLLASQERLIATVSDWLTRRFP
jgi:pimeloyl-ACP methyl ester carboxylesterase